MLRVHGETHESPEVIFPALAELTPKIKHKLKLGEYDRELEGLATQAIQKLMELGDRQSAPFLVSDSSDLTLEYLTALAWAAEVMEYFGRLTKGSDTYALVEEHGPRIYASLLGRLPPTTEMDQKIAREEIWVALSWARGLYRTHKYTDALEVLLRCEDFVENKLQTTGFECNLTLATLWSLHGKVLRQLVQHEEAKVFYDRALSRIYKRLQNGSDARINCEVARILAFGHGWILYTQGLLQEARAAVSTALVVLQGTNDVIYKAYGELLLCSISRATIGMYQPTEIDQRTLTETIEAMKKPYATFKEYGHEPYAARAAYELALSFLYRGFGANMNREEDFTLAEEKLREVLTLDDNRWQANGWVVMSRLQRAKGDMETAEEARKATWMAAEESAKRALKIAVEANLDFCKTDAHIALGEVLAGRPEVDDQSLRASLDHFGEALKLAATDAKGAVCHLHIARVHLLRGNLRDAQLELAEWRKVEQKIQHGFVREFGRQVASAVRQAEQKYLIVDTTNSLNIEQHTGSLVRFLLTQARARHSNIEERCNQLGVKRATYYNLVRKVGEIRSRDDRESEGHSAAPAAS